MSIISYFREENLPVRPWTRFFARIADMTVFFLIFYLFIHTFFASLFHSPLRMTFISIIWYIFAEAILLSNVGTTLGKSLLCVTVTDKEGKRLSFSAAFKRTFWVYVKGYAFGIPVLLIIALIIAYKNLQANQITSWDRDCQTTVTHQNSTMPVWIAVVVVPFLLQFIMLWAIFSETLHTYDISKISNISEKNISTPLQSPPEKQEIPSQTATASTPANISSNNPTPETSSPKPTNGRPSWVQDIPKNERPSWMHEVPSNESPSPQSTSSGD